MPHDDKPTGVIGLVRTYRRTSLAALGAATVVGPVVNFVALFLIHVQGEPAPFRLPSKYWQGFGLMSWHLHGYLLLACAFAGAGLLGLLRLLMIAELRKRSRKSG